MVRLAALVLGVALVATPVRADVALRDLVEIVDISSLRLSPDGRRIAFRQQAASLERNAKEISWWVAELSGAPQARQVANGGRAIWTYGGTVSDEPPQWSNDGRAIYFRALVGGEVQVWRSTIGNRAAEAVTADAADVAAFSLRPDGAGLDYKVGATRNAILAAEQGQRAKGVRIDASVDPAQDLFDAVEINGRPAAQRLTGKWFQRTGLLGSGALQTKRIDFASRDQTPLQSDSAVLDPGVVERIAGDIRVRRPDGTALNPPAGWPPGRVSWTAWRPRHDQMLVAVADLARRQSLYLWDLGGGRLRKVIDGEGLLGGGDFTTPCAVAEDTAVCVEATADHPPRLVAIGLDDGRLRALARPNATLRLSAPVAPSILSWTAADGRPVSGWLFLPRRNEGARRAPLFVTYYVCEGYLRGGVGDEYPLALLAQAGIASLCINQISRNGADYDAAADYDLAVSAIRSAVNLLDQRGLIDREKVGMGGFSFGSEVTTWTAIHTDLLAAAAIASTQIEPAYYWLNGAPGRDNHAVLKKSWGLGAPEETPDRWRLFSPALNAEKIRAPLLMQLPEQEYRLSFELFARLSRTRTPVDLYVFPQEPHNKVQPAHRLAVYQRNLDWFRFWLQGVEDADPDKASQYALWRAMAARRATPQEPPVDNRPSHP